MNIRSKDDVMKLKRPELMKLAAQQNIGFTVSDTNIFLQEKIIASLSGGVVVADKKADTVEPVPTTAPTLAPDTYADDVAEWEAQISGELKQYENLGMEITFDNVSWTFYFGAKSISGNKTTPLSLVLRAAQSITGRSFE